MRRRHEFLLFACLCAMMLFAGCDNSSESKKSYPNAGLLADAGDVDDAGVVLLDTRSAAAYGGGHIPGAVNMQWNGFVDASVNLKPVDDLENLLGGAGLTRESKIIIYDNTTASWGASGRLFWMFEYLGCKNVRILNGGWDKWVTDGNSTETAVQTLPAATFTASVNDKVVADKTHVASRMNDDDFIIIDTRTDEEFIGWQLYGENRGGHVKGAVQLPYAWYFNSDKTVLDYADLKNLFESHGITKDKEVTAYCTVGIRSAFAYFLTRLMGYERASNYDGSISDWAASDATIYPMEKLPNYEKLVHPAWVKGLINGDIVPDGADGYVIVETGWGGPEATGYDNGHIPGAIHVNTDEIEYDYFEARSALDEGEQTERSTTVEQDAAKGLGPDDTLPRNFWNLYPDEYLLPAIAHMGITTDTTVVVYSSSASAAGRLVLTLMYAGVKDVRLLNGGLAAWKAAGNGVETETTDRTPVANFGAALPLHPEYLTPIGEVRAIANGNGDPLDQIVDIRDHDEYTGKTAPYSYIPASGRIQNAVWGHAGKKMSDFVDADGTMRAFTEVQAMWAAEGITAEKHGIHYCGTGWRAALTWFYTYLMGWEGSSLYDGGWYQWSMGPDKDINPVIDENPKLP